ncbi:Wzz/FepE/Etk N-terminal domain-containing protein [Gammaproteobacteria bacterium]|nr:Wzz/FepE/Etk N-terminal domain-containing protein [Gammaproteobacteria bacterium]MDC0511154.1 Wzz/FepE/Etk N-terminal domain-containing protein [bacterium]
MQSNHNHSDIIDLKQLFYILWNKKIFISTVTVIFAVFSIFYALSLPNIYKSKATLSPTSSNDSLSSQLSSFSSLANIAGVKIPGGEVSKTQEAIKRINSLEFFSKHIFPEIKLENLMAVSQWIPEKNIILYDSNIFDIKGSKWVREVTYPYKVIPSKQEAFNVYRDILSISEDSTTSFVTLVVKHESPYISKRWVDLIIKSINLSMREEDKKISQNSLEYLNDFLESTNIKSIRDTISVLQEEQMKTLMLTSSSDSYIFKTIDSAVVPELKSEPKRSLICILGTILGFITSILIVLIVNYFKKTQQKTI